MIFRASWALIGPQIPRGRFAPAAPFCKGGYPTGASACRNHSASCPILGFALRFEAQSTHCASVSTKHQGRVGHWRCFLDVPMGAP
jgi:hypothetical protein